MRKRRTARQRDIEKAYPKKQFIAKLRRLADTLEIPVDCVHVKGKTNEGVDAAGREEAIAVHAVALIARRSPQAPGGDAPVV